MSVSRGARSLTHITQGPSSSSYICSQCRLQAARRLQSRTLSSSASRAQKLGLANQLTEGLRKRIWGIDAPSGKKDSTRNEGKEAQIITEPEQSSKDSDPAPRTLTREEQDTTVAEASLQAQARKKEEAVVHDTNYIPAANWDGLIAIGGPTGWWEGSFDEQNQFEGFMSTETLTSKEDLEKVIRKALIEVYVMKAYDYPLDTAITAYETSEGRDQFLTQFRSSLERAYFASGESGQPAVLDIAEADELQEDVEELVQEEKTELEQLGATPVAEVLEPDTTREGVEKGASESPAEELEAVDEGATTDLSQAESTSVPAILQETLATSSPTDAWRDVSITDIKIKFAVLKRVTQLTGRRFPDHAIADLETGKDLFNVLVKKPKPKKLAQILTVREALTQLPNVEIKERRYTPIDREKEVGRWKVIERELEKRGLPITGKEIPGRYT